MNIKQLTKELVGLKVEEAKLMYKDYNIRIVVLDGINLMCTEDYIISRINVSVEKGIITKVEGLG